MTAETPKRGTREWEWWVAGAAAEAEARTAPYKALPKNVREMTDYIDAVVEHQPRYVATPGELVRHLTWVFRSTFTKAEKRAIRRALRGKS